MIPARDSPSSSPLGPHCQLLQAIRPLVSSLSHTFRIPLSPGSFLVVRKHAYPYPSPMGTPGSYSPFFQLPAPLSHLDSRTPEKSWLYFAPVARSGHHCSNFYPYTLFLPLLERHVNGVLRNIFSFRFLLLNFGDSFILYVSVAHSILSLSGIPRCSVESSSTISSTFCICFSIIYHLSECTESACSCSWTTYLRFE